MKTSELRNLIREEVRKVLKESTIQKFNEGHSKLTNTNVSKQKSTSNLQEVSFPGLDDMSGTTVVAHTLLWSLIALYIQKDTIKSAVTNFFYKHFKSSPNQINKVKQFVKQKIQSLPKAKQTYVHTLVARLDKYMSENDKQGMLLVQKELIDYLKRNGLVSASAEYFNDTLINDDATNG